MREAGGEGDGEGGGRRRKGVRGYFVVTIGSKKKHTKPNTYLLPRARLPGYNADSEKFTDSCI